MDPAEPRDVRTVAQVLSTMGVEDVEPRVLNQFLDFMHRYVTEVLQEAKEYCEHAGRSQLELDDVRIAIQSRVNYSFTQPPPRELVMELARQKNSNPLPAIPSRIGVHLPPDRFCLTAANYQIVTQPTGSEDSAHPGSQGNGSLADGSGPADAARPGPADSDGTLQNGPSASVEAAPAAGTSSGGGGPRREAAHKIEIKLRTETMMADSEMTEAEPEAEVEADGDPAEGRAAAEVDGEASDPDNDGAGTEWE